MVTKVFVKERQKLALYIMTGLIGHLLFNSFISEVFLFIENFDICNFADDNTLLSCGDDLSVILSMKF